MKKILYVILGIIVTGSLMTSLLFVMKSISLDSQLAQSKMIASKLQADVATLQAEKERLAKEKDKLQADTVSYLSINTKLQQEKERIQKRIDDSEKVMDRKEKELGKLREDLKKLEKIVAKGNIGQKEKYITEKNELKKQIAALEAKIKKEKAVYYYNLAVAYTKAELTDDAIEMYEKALEFEPFNADAHYNLGLLYDNVKEDPYRAVEHYRRYLELEPDSPDREEIEGWIERLK